MYGVRAPLPLPSQKPRNCWKIPQLWGFFNVLHFHFLMIFFIFERIFHIFRTKYDTKYDTKTGQKITPRDYSPGV